MANGRLLEAQESPLGGFYIWLTEATLSKLRALRGPGEGYSEANLRLAEKEDA